MKAIVITARGGPEVLALRDLERPQPAAEQVLVRVRACGVNRADLLQNLGQYPAPPGAPADIPGMEFAGEVEQLGPGVTGGLKPGDRVCGITGGGAYAEYLLAHERMLALMPSGMGFEEAAAVPEAFMTALDALETRASLRPGERVLIHAVGGGVGSAALQLAHAMGCFVFGTSRTAEKLRKAEALGLHVGIDTSRDDFAELVRAQTGGEGVHVVLDHLGASALPGNLAALATKGRLVLVGLLGGPSAPLDLALVMHKRLTIVGTVLRARPLEEKIAVTQQFAARVVPWLARGQVKPVL
ncbi:MAG TPA: NAD(P)H-quinone oxidoreductase, partial [Isosphaeraceae bacterium]|nr:NAD(P)H-quinone oxidoreductase [Isosphaeraceae bacterium]